MFDIQAKIFILRQGVRDMLMSIKALLILTTCFSGVILTPRIYAESQAYYRWTDEAGITHYELNPPDNRASTKVFVNAHQPTQEPNKSEPKINTQEKEVNEDQFNKIKSQRQEQCNSERERIKKLERKTLKRTREDGRLRTLTRDEVTQRLSDAKKFITEACR